MKFILIFLFLIAIIRSRIVLAKTRSVGVAGTVICDDKPISDTEVELYDERNAGNTNAIAKTKTNAQGRFVIKGISKKTTFDPQFSISHGCRAQKCVRRVLLRIPDKYLTSGSQPRETYDIGVIDMKKKFPTETKTCPT